MNKKTLLVLAVQGGVALVLALFLLMFAIKGADLFYGERETAKKRGYKIDIAATPAATPVSGGSKAATAAADSKPLEIIPYLEKADLKLGEQLLKRCQVCHGFEKGKPNGVGPNQYGLVGRKIASVDGFAYSDALKAKSGEWNFQTLSEFLTEPQKAVPGTKMGFAGLKKPEERAAIIAYINRNFSDQPVAIPSQ